MDAEVLIVGLGPVGAMMAGLLGQHGVSVIVVEKEAGPYPLPRAVHFDHEIMRLFQQLGVADQVLSHARDVPDYEFRNAAGEVLMLLPPARETPSGWGGGYMFHQPGLEAVLRERLAGLPTVEVRTGVRLERFSQGPDGVTAEISGQDGAETIRARYMVGCDGASSLVREAIGGGLFDYQFDEPWLVVDVRAGEGCTTPRLNIQLCDPGRPTTCVMSGPGRHRWEFMLLPGEDAEAMRTEESVRTLLAPWNCGPVEIERRAVYRFHGLVANCWRDGRVLIAGDAAHQTPPFAGQGMCAGLRDAANLAWKLAAVVQGEAGEALLDSYQTEREPHARAAIELAIGMGRVVCLLDPAAAAQRDAGMLAAKAAGTPPLPPLTPRPFEAGAILPGAVAAGTQLPQPRVGDLRFDDVVADVVGDRPWLLSRGPTGGVLKSLTLDDPALAPFRPALSVWLDRQGVEAVLVRPDRYIFGAGEPAVLLAAWAETLTGEPALERA